MIKIYANVISCIVILKEILTIREVNCKKLKHKKNTSLLTRVIRYHCRFPGQGVEFPHLDMFRAQLDVGLDNLLQLTLL